MIDHRTTASTVRVIEPAQATEPLVLHPRGGVVIVTLLLLTLGIMLLPLIVSWAGAPLG